MATRGRRGPERTSKRRKRSRSMRNKPCGKDLDPCGFATLNGIDVCFPCRFLPRRVGVKRFPLLQNNKPGGLGKKHFPRETFDVLKPTKLTSRSFKLILPILRRGKPTPYWIKVISHEYVLQLSAPHDTSHSTGPDWHHVLIGRERKKFV